MILAAVNPVGVHDDRSKTVWETLKIAFPFLSQSNLVYVLTDKADEERYRFISADVMGS